MHSTEVPEARAEKALPEIKKFDKSDFLEKRLSGEPGTQPKIPFGDPAYRKYLEPGQFPHSEVTKAYDLTRSGREKVYDNLNRVLMSIGSMQDEFGVYRMEFDPRFFEGALDQYVQAVKQAFGPETGLKVASTGSTHYSVDVFKDTWASGSTFKTRTTFGIYLVTDTQAEKKIELTKIKVFEEIEELLAYVRHVVSKELQVGAEEWKALTQIFGQNPTDEEIRKKLGVPLAEASSDPIMTMALKKRTREDLLQLLPDNAQERHAKLKELLEKTIDLMRIADDENTKARLLIWLELIEKEL